MAQIKTPEQIALETGFKDENKFLQYSAALGALLGTVQGIMDILEDHFWNSESKLRLIGQFVEKYKA